MPVVLCWALVCGSDARGTCAKVAVLIISKNSLQLQAFVVYRNVKLLAERALTAIAYLQWTVSYLRSTVESQRRTIIVRYRRYPPEKISLLKVVELCNTGRALLLLCIMSCTRVDIEQILRVQ